MSSAGVSEVLAEPIQQVMEAPFTTPVLLGAALCLTCTQTEFFLSSSPHSGCPKTSIQSQMGDDWAWNSLRVWKFNWGSFKNGKKGVLAIILSRSYQFPDSFSRHQGWQLFDSCSAGRTFGRRKPVRIFLVVWGAKSPRALWSGKFPPTSPSCGVIGRYWVCRALSIEKFVFLHS